MSSSRPHPPHSPATTRRFSTNAPPRAGAAEGGAEHAGVRRALSVRVPASRLESNEALLCKCCDERFASALGRLRCRPRRAAHRSTRRTRGRNASEGGEERSGAKRRYPFAHQPGLRSTARADGTTVSHRTPARLRRRHPLAAHRRTRRNARAQRDGSSMRLAAARLTPARGPKPSNPPSAPELHCRRGWMSVSRPSASRPVIAGNDAPPLDERAATRGRGATEGGDERAVRSAVIRLSASLRTPAASDATMDAQGRR